MRQVGERVWVLVDHDEGAPYYTRSARVISADQSSVCLWVYVAPGRPFFVSHDCVFTTHDEAQAAGNDSVRVTVRSEDLPDFCR